MNKTITITSKGQTTLPVSMRKKMGISSQGGTLQINYDEESNEIIISKPISPDELTKKISKYIRPGTKPVTDVSAYYQKNRNAS